MVLKLSLLLSFFVTNNLYATTTYIYKGKDGVVWFGDQAASSRLGDVDMIGIYGRPPAVKACGKVNEDILNLKAMHFVGYMKTSAKKHLLDYRLIKAMIKTESCFEVEAISSVGAKGLMQLMPRTAKYLGVSNAFNAEQNIEGGAKYIRRLLVRFNHDLKKALAAYNAGPTAVDKYKGIPPYKETKRYVKKVMAEYHRYAQSL